MLKEGDAISEDGTRIFYRYLKKKGPWLVFIHGGGGSVSSWFQQERFFSRKKYSLLFVDLRGHGKSGRGSGRGFFSVRKCAADIKAVMDRLGIRKAVIIGHCFGSFVAQQLAHDHPLKIERLILINSGSESLGNSLPDFLTKLFLGALFFLLRVIPYQGIKGHADYSKYVGSWDISLRRIFADIKYCGFATYSAMGLSSLFFKSPLSSTKIKSLCVYGKRDIVISYKRAVELAARIKGELVLIDTNHVAVFNAANEVNQAIEKFLNG